MKLSEQQIKLVRDQVHNNDLTIESLKDDLIDHLCCVAEAKTDNGKTFEEALHEALRELAPDGLLEIETETIMLLNSKKYIPMKKFMFFAGCICSMAISTGWLLKFLNVALPLGNMLFGLGAFGFMIVFLPMLAVSHLRTSGRSMAEKLRFVFGITSIIVIGMAILARLMHMPGADQVMIIGLVIFTFGFIPFLYFTMYKKAVS
jgi:hypothetical protein